MLRSIADWVTFSLLRLDPASKLGSALQFFIYDSFKIFLMLFVMIALIGILRSYLSQDKVKGWLSGKGIMGNFFAALFGAVTPFCSCSSIPIFFGFLSAGIPLGITFSFLITSPLINEYLVVLMLGFFGLKITALYVASGMLIGILCGLVLGKMNLEKYLVKGLITEKDDLTSTTSFKNFGGRILFGIAEAWSLIRKLWAWIFIGIGIGAFIHNYVPEAWIQSVISKTGFLSVPIAVLIGVPMYGSCAAIVPIAVALFQKGIPLGTALAFMMAISALSLPEAIILRRAMKLQLIAIFFAITTLGIIFTGYLFNFAQKFLF